MNEKYCNCEECAPHNKFKCDMCEDTGEIWERAYQRGGEIVEEQVTECLCKKLSKIEDSE